jgi:hypothetical protein
MRQVCVALQRATEGPLTPTGNVPRGTESILPQVHSESVRRPAAGPVRSAVTEYVGYRIEGAVPCSHRGLPGPTLTTVVSLGDPVEISVMPEAGQRPGRFGAFVTFDDLGPSSTYVVCEDPDALHDRALAAGAEIIRALTDQDYGSREFSARDPEGNVWSFGTYRGA